jgi:hypothetical protein
VEQALAPIRALEPSRTSLKDKGADDPLSAAEVAEMKEHFKFLRQHRKLLKLRLNATEDLLLNGVRDPVHRGVCQHLLAKVEKDRVLQVCERLPASEAASLLAGVLRFAPEMSYVLRYLECVTDARSRPEAAAALVHALRRIQFTETSSAQMRQVLALIVSVFPSAELPVLLFNWLYNGAFRQAIERSSEELPSELAQVAVPLSIVHELLNREGRRGQGDGQHASKPEVRAGVGLLLRAAGTSLAELPERVRRRLFELGLTLGLDDTAELSGLVRVFETLNWQREDDRSAAALSLARAWLSAGDEAGAKKLLGRDWFVGESSVQAKRWLRLLTAPRVGPIALDERGSDRGRRRPQSDREVPGQQQHSPERWLRGFHVPTQTSVRFRYGTPEQQMEFRARVELWQRLLVPGVSRPWAQGVAEGVPYVALPVVGTSLRANVGAPVTPAELAQRAIELCALLHATALAGVRLPDSEAGRFSVDAGGRIWLTDVWGAEPTSSDEALRAHVNAAFDLVKGMLPPDVPVQAPSNMAELVAQIESGRTPVQAS